MSGTIQGIDIKYLLKTSNIFDSVSSLLETDTSDNAIIKIVSDISEKAKKSST
mgnify:CR=1 FL=1